jgi:hypothetical protein
MFPLAALLAASLQRYENTAAGGSSLGGIGKWSEQDKAKSHAERALSDSQAV